MAAIERVILGSLYVLYNQLRIVSVQWMMRKGINVIGEANYTELYLEIVFRKGRGKWSRFKDPALKHRKAS